LRLPIPPQRRLAIVYVENIIETKRFVKKNIRNSDNCKKKSIVIIQSKDRHGHEKERGLKPLLNNYVLFHGNRCDGAAVYSLLTVAGVAGIGVDDPGLVVS
jgi:hypothetical protein